MGVKLMVDGKIIPLNDFVETILAGTITGAVTTLHGIDADWSKIEIQIEKSVTR
ncbi:MAG: hypothetical protein LBQ98_08485 [Nitrososphaerota archaeon]|jgi:hypothetical protein|nr:hypothetical protein [Nitrososphaerota archaeon]